MENGVICGRKREQISEKGTTDLIIPCSWNNINSVIKDWKEIMKNEQEIAVKIFQKFFYEHPSYKNLFPSLTGISDDDLPGNNAFLEHSCAVIRALNAVLRFLGGIYEDDGEWVPIIGETHQKREISHLMFEELKDTILDVCWGYLKSDRKSRDAWSEVMNFIFENYLTKAYQE